jgi:hypothetical protein
VFPRIPPSVTRWSTNCCKASEKRLGRACFRSKGGRENALGHCGATERIEGVEVSRREVGCWVSVRWRSSGIEEDWGVVGMGVDVRAGMWEDGLPI